MSGKGTVQGECLTLWLAAICSVQMRDSLRRGGI